MTVNSTDVIKMGLKRTHKNIQPGDEEDHDAVLLTKEEAHGRGLDVIEKNIFNFQDLQYFATLYIGENQKEMTFIYDTGSTYLWFPTTGCNDCHTTNLYDPTSTYESTGTTDDITYGSGFVAGVVAYDNIRATEGGTPVRMSK